MTAAQINRAWLHFFAAAWILSRVSVLYHTQQRRCHFLFASVLCEHVKPVLPDISSVARHSPAVFGLISEVECSFYQHCGKLQENAG